jgi:L-alanine-DL-glutamate epimerase-like enolase superfamily enzyme
MKIAAANVRPVRLRFARPMHTALGEFREREVVHFELRDSDGIGGWGEAAPWPGFGTETPADSLTVLQRTDGPVRSSIRAIRTVAMRSRYMIARPRAPRWTARCWISPRGARGDQCGTNWRRAACVLPPAQSLRVCR